MYMLPAIQECRLAIFVDALCIKQASFLEKTTQVNLMRYIYERAEGVWAWVGAPLSDLKADLAAQMLKNGYQFERDRSVTSRLTT